MLILAIDPGNKISGYVVFDGQKVVDTGVIDNEAMLLIVDTCASGYTDTCAIEMIQSMGMAVGKEVFHTCVWIGRFIERWHQRNAKEVSLIHRNEVKMHVCLTPRAKDANIRQALIDRYGAPGTKKDPGPTYGVKSHAWQALGVAATALGKREG